MNEIVCKIGETNIVLSPTLKSTNPTTGVLEAVDLTDWTAIKMTVSTQRGLVIINDLPCTADPDQVTNKGKIETNAFDLTKDEYPNLVTGKHRVEFAGTRPSAGGVRFFPTNADGERTYGKFIIQKSL